MGHSPGIRDVAWLAEKILLWVFATEEPPGIAYFELVGCRQPVTMLRHPVEGGEGERSFTFTLSTSDEKSGYASGCDRQASLTEMLHVDRCLHVAQRTSGNFTKPRSARSAIREMLRQALALQPWGPCPILGQHQLVIVSEDTSKEEFTMQLAIVFSRWGLVDLTQEDTKTFVSYLCHLWRNPNTYHLAAEEALPLILMNWVAPDSPRSFRAYARRMTLAAYATGVRRDSSGRSSFTRKSSAFDLGEGEVERSRGWKRRQEMRCSHLSVPALSRASGVDLRRIYEAIKNGSLPAVKLGMSLCVDNDTAHEFILRSNQKRAITALTRKLSDLGQSKEAVRKQIYRLRKAGTPERKIVEYLKTRIARSTGERPKLTI